MKYLKSKLNKAVVTKSDINCEGSITIGKDLMLLMDVAEFELVHVNNATTGARIETYVLKGTEGVLEVNGAASKMFNKGDSIHVLSWCDLNEFNRTYKATPRILYTDYFLEGNVNVPYFKSNQVSYYHDMILFYNGFLPESFKDLQVI